MIVASLLFCSRVTWTGFMTRTLRRIGQSAKRCVPWRRHLIRPTAQSCSAQDLLTTSMRSSARMIRWAEARQHTSSFSPGVEKELVRRDAAGHAANVTVVKPGDLADDRYQAWHCLADRFAESFSVRRRDELFASVVVEHLQFAFPLTTEAERQKHGSAMDSAD